MRSAPRATAVVLLLAIVLAVLVSFTIAPYGFRPSALFHLSNTVASEGSVPKGFVVLDVPAYDGAMYFRIAERLPIFLDSDRWSELLGKSPGAYAYQRILLPVLGYILALGKSANFAWSFLAINLACLLASASLVYRAFRRVLPALAIALSPAALLGLHFMTAEPLSILLLTLLLLRIRKHEVIDGIGAALLCLLVLAREIHLPLVVFALVWLLWNRKWTSALLTLPALLVFAVWQGTLFQIFGSIPFLVNQENLMLPLVAPISMLLGVEGYDTYALSSITLFALFVLPALLLVLRKLWKDRTSLGLVPSLLLGYLAIMLVMPLHIWGSITSIGRAITPVYPLATVEHAEGSRWSTLLLAGIIMLGLASGIGIALIAHPYSITS